MKTTTYFIGWLITVIAILIIICHFGDDTNTTEIKDAEGEESEHQKQEQTATEKFNKKYAKHLGCHKQA